MPDFILEEVLRVVVGLIALGAPWWVTADLQKRRRDDKTKGGSDDASSLVR